MAKSGAKGIWVRDDEKIILGDGDDAQVQFDGSDLVVTLTGAVKFDSAATMTYVLKFDSAAGPVSAAAVGGSNTAKLKILVGSDTYYIPLYTG